MIDIKGQILAAFGGMLGVCEHIKLNIYSRRANKMQKTCIKRLMRKNKSTVYGKINNFKDVKSSAVCYAWFIWEKSYKGDTIVRWI